MRHDVGQLLANTAKDRGLSLSELSKGAGKNHAYLQQFVTRGTPSKLPEDVRLYVANKLGLPEELLGGRPSGLGNGPMPTRQVPLKGYIGAGGEIEALDSGYSDTVEAPADAHPDTVVGEVRGLSMLPAYEEGTLLYWSRLLPPDAMINRRCVAQLGDGRIMVKMLKRGADANLWTLVSINPAYPDIEDVPVEWVAKIDWTKPL